MLETIGVGSMNELLVDIPQSLRLESLQLPDGLSEFETMAQISALANRNTVFPDRLTFRGGGIYRLRRDGFNKIGEASISRKAMCSHSVFAT